MVLWAILDEQCVLVSIPVEYSQYLESDLTCYWSTLF